MDPYAYIPEKTPGLLLIYITDLSEADEDGNTPQTSAAFAAAPEGTQDCGDSSNTGRDQHGGWTYTLRLPRPLHGAAREQVAQRVTWAVKRAADPDARPRTMADRLPYVAAADPEGLAAWTRASTARNRAETRAERERGTRKGITPYTRFICGVTADAVAKALGACAERCGVSGARSMADIDDALADRARAVKASA